jgi:hypothetical protein
MGEDARDGRIRALEERLALLEDRLGLLDGRLALLDGRLASLKLLEDERDLRDLLARYSFTADLFRGDAWVELWTDDGIYDLGDGNAPGGYNGRFTGSRQLLELITGPGMPPEGASQHHVHGPLRFHIDGDRATVDGYSVTFVHRESGNEVWNLGFNRWSFVRVDSIWKIAERRRREIGTNDREGVITGGDSRG